MSIIELMPVQGPIPMHVPQGLRSVSRNIGAAGEAIQISVPAAAADGVFGTVEQSDQASFPKTKTEQAYTATVSITTATGNVVRHVPMITATFPIVQTLPEDRILVVAPRCHRSSSGIGELNAKVYGADGSLQATFCLGDGIEHVQVDGNGHLWVGYFDEGVFGNFGWGLGDGATPWGSAGIVCYDTSGKKLWEFQAPQGFDQISDCYALNVAENAVWACYYVDFPIIQIDPQSRVRAWTSSLRGPRALAVSGDAVLAYGGYGQSRQDCSLLRLRGGTAEVVARVVLHLPHVDLNETKVIGRGQSLHVFTSDEWYVFCVPS